MKKKLQNILSSILVYLLCALIIGSWSFVVSTKTSLSVYAEKFSESDRRFIEILEKLKSIDEKISKHIERDE